MSFSLDGYDGHAALLWGGQEVDAVDLVVPEVAERLRPEVVAQLPALT